MRIGDCLEGWRLNGTELDEYLKRAGELAASGWMIEGGTLKDAVVSCGGDG